MFKKKILTGLLVLATVGAMGTGGFLLGYSLTRENVSVSAPIEDPKDAASEPEEEKEPAWSDERIIAVMIDNDDKNARPHAGIEEAFLLYEMYVEGSSTRLMALFKDADAEKIGPVRSSRHYFLDYALDSGAIYAHAGYSPYAQSDIAKLKINNVNGLYLDGTVYWRERKYKGDWHSLYTSITKLRQYAETQKYALKSDKRPFEYHFPARTYEGEAASRVVFPYSSFYKVSYAYDPETGLYERMINGQPHPTASGAKLAAREIVVQFVKSYPYGDGSARLNMNTTGEGEGFLLSGGVLAPLTWKRPSRTAQLKFYLENGEELKLNHGGQTYVQVIPPSMKYTIE